MADERLGERLGGVAGGRDRDLEAELAGRVRRHWTDAGDGRTLAAADESQAAGTDEAREVANRRAAGEGERVDLAALEGAEEPRDVEVGRDDGRVGDDIVDVCAAMCAISTLVADDAIDGML